MAKVRMENLQAGFFYPNPPVLVSCVDKDGKPNIITIGAAGIVESRPPAIGIAVGTRQYSLSLIAATGDFGVNLPNRRLVRQTDFCGTRSGRDMDKFAAAGLTVQQASVITSPLIAECPVSLECRLLQTVHVGAHDWLIGEIVAAHVEEECLDGEKLRGEALEAMACFAGAYWAIGERLEATYFTVEK